MAKNEEKQKALSLRKKGYSYNKIHKIVKVSKSTLSNWLKDFPLSRTQINTLRGNNPKRIEKFRNTMKTKREVEHQSEFTRVQKQLGKLTKREKLIAGLFLYWGEGTKAASYTTALTNTDPDMLVFFLEWLHALGVAKGDIRIVLHLYKDMNIVQEMNFWSNYLKIPLKQFRKPYIKNTRICDITYRSGFNHGTCSVVILDKKTWLFVKSALKVIRIRP
jgi:hypothetical protein